MLLLEYSTKALEYYQTREQWLERAARLLCADLLPRFAGQYRVACGWPATGALARKKRRVGECWYPAHSADRTTHNIFISPLLAKPSDVLETLAHELIHIAAGPKCGHAGQFISIARKVGFTKPWTATPASPELAKRLNCFAQELGRYPHATIDLARRKKQSTRLLKLECPGCGYTVRTTQKWIEVGMPTCPCGEEME